MKPEMMVPVTESNGLFMVLLLSFYFPKPPENTQTPIPESTKKSGSGLQESMNNMLFK
jgi:hypothetical protein